MSIEGYPYYDSVRAGEDVELCVSTTARRFRVRFFRQGRTLERVEALDAGPFPGWDLPVGSAVEEWGWPRYRIALPQTTRSGVYVALLVEEDAETGAAPDDDGDDLLNRAEGVALVVVRPPRGTRSADVIYKVSTATYQAYNEAGGASLYGRAKWSRGAQDEGFKVTLRRTGGGIGKRVTCNDATDVHHPESRRQTFAHWDAPLIQWLEQEDFACDYLTDIDLHADPAALDGYNVLLSVGHDEYWSSEMRDRVLEFRARGGNVAFLSGNIANWRIGVIGDRSAIFTSKGYPGARDGVKHETDSWHAIDPTDALTLVATQHGAGWWDGRRPSDAYAVEHPQHWVFAGTGLEKGDAFGTAGEPVIGYEVDGALFAVQNGTKVAVDDEGRPSDLCILASARLSEGWVSGSPTPRATMGISTSESGGITFQAATTDWPICVRTDEQVARITRNVIERLSLRSIRIVGPLPRDEDVGMPAPVEGALCTAYVDLGRLADQLGGDDLVFEWGGSGYELVAGAGSPVVMLRPSPQATLITLSVTLSRGDRPVAFGSRSVAVMSEVDGLRTAICASIRNMVMPSEPAAPLFAPTESPHERIRDVSPTRLAWLRERARRMDEATRRLEDLWTQDGSLAGSIVDPELLGWDERRWSRD